MPPMIVHAGPRVAERAYGSDASGKIYRNPLQPRTYPETAATGLGAVGCCRWINIVKSKDSYKVSYGLRHSPLFYSHA